MVRLPRAFKIVALGKMCFHFSISNCTVRLGDGQCVHTVHHCELHS
jgi:hypothetical protein